MYAVISSDNKVTSMVHSKTPKGLDISGCILIESEVNVVGHSYSDGEFISRQKSEKELASEAKAYLDSTDYIYHSQKEKGLSDKQVAEKYADIIAKRIEQRTVVSVYQDSLTTD